ncbi:Glycosyltransferase involved in cell wall bisynthesis [Actinoalloteichus cyanogriseus DSM 43889]|uniref:Glycosyltransferase involved in cell wall bisynthesis n=1 Tax=Actinoalloteichus caeruleus DSM 43889 TaxID=1120930 RepID=A0ABT1JBE6_ACTCY|nr:Glycosyltransferase involved in cell wall bisynthesis [Actinoalloteichus caeruleus DSM 43889]
MSATAPPTSTARPPEVASPRAPVVGEAAARPLRVLVWHVHGSWTTAFVQGRHHVLLPRTPDPGPWGLGRADRDWPERAVEVPVQDLHGQDVDVVVLQRPEELELAARWLGREPGRDVPAVYVEHNTPRHHVPDTRHPLADRTDIPIAHVTHFNRLLWDSGRAPTLVVEHGVPDPGHRYSGELDAAAVVVNEPVRRGRVTGTDLLADFARTIPLHVFGLGTTTLPDHLGVAPDRLRALGDVREPRLHEEMARRRLYLHPPRWTSLGLALIEAMMLGLPVVGFACTEAVEVVPPTAGVLSTRPDVLADAVRGLRADPELARALGAGARRTALARFGVDAFTRDWDRVLGAAVAEGPRRPRRSGPRTCAGSTTDSGTTVHAPPAG